MCDVVYTLESDKVISGRLANRAQTLIDKTFEKDSGQLLHYWGLSEYGKRTRGYKGDKERVVAALLLRELA